MPKALEASTATAFAPRFAVSCSRELLEAVAALSVSEQALVHTHAAENRDEVAFVQRMSGGLSNLEYLADAGAEREAVGLADARAALALADVQRAGHAGVTRLRRARSAGAWIVLEHVVLAAVFGIDVNIEVRAVEVMLNDRLQHRKQLTHQRAIGSCLDVTRDGVEVPHRGIDSVIQRLAFALWKQVGQQAGLHIV